MFWFVEKHQDDTGILMGAQRAWTYHSSFQEITVLETHTWGRVLILDGLVQKTDRDEFVYHEMLAHVPLTVHPNPESVLIIGGGDGGTLREVLRHPVRSVILCEIDPMVIEVVKKHWPDESTVFSQNRVQIVHKDGRQFLEETDLTFDVIIVDSSEPISHSRTLFSDGFIEQVKRRLKQPGIYVTQSLSPFYAHTFLREFTRRLRTFFPTVHVYHAHVAAYPAGWWSFTLSANDPSLDPRTPNPAHTEFLTGLRYYDPEVHRAAFVLPKFLKTELNHDEAS